MATPGRSWVPAGKTRFEIGAAGRSYRKGQPERVPVQHSRETRHHHAPTALPNLSGFHVGVGSTRQTLHIPPAVQPFGWTRLGLLDDGQQSHAFPQLGNVQLHGYAEQDTR